jgi:hypothetical protein
MTDNSEMRSAVLKALASNFRGLTLRKIGDHVGQQLDVTIHLKNDLSNSLLPAMKDDGLISVDNRTWHITEIGREQEQQQQQPTQGAIAEEPQEKAQVICFAYYLLSRSCPDTFCLPREKIWRYRRKGRLTERASARAPRHRR